MSLPLIFKSQATLREIPEEWIPVYNYDGFYEVSNYGRVRGVDRIIKNNGWDQFKPGKILNGHKRKDGYIEVALCKDSIKKVHLAHRIVSLSFLKNVDNKRCVNHKNCIRHDNRVENLEWCTHKENSMHGALYGDLNNSDKRTPVVAIKISNGEKLYFESTREAERNGFSQSGVSDCIRGRIKTHRGYKWSRA